MTPGRAEDPVRTPRARTRGRTLASGTTKAKAKARASGREAVPEKGANRENFEGGKKEKHPLVTETLAKPPVEQKNHQQTHRILRHVKIVDALKPGGTAHDAASTCVSVVRCQEITSALVRHE